MHEAKQDEENMINEGDYYLLLWISDVLFVLFCFASSWAGANLSGTGIKLACG